MKKIVSMFLACALCLGLLAGCQGQGGAEPWTLEDFSIYDTDGKIVEEFPEATDIVEANGRENWCTKRGLVSGDAPSKILELYPMMEYSVVRMQFNPEGTSQLREKYKTGEELIKNCEEEIGTEDIVITIAFTEKDGVLEPIKEYSDSGYPKKPDDEKTYQMEFWLRKDMTIGLIYIMVK